MADEAARDLTLLTASKAAAILDVDPKTFRAMGLPFVPAGKSKRYTRLILEQWLERSVRQCQESPPKSPGRQKGGKSPVKNISGGGRGRRSGRSASASNIIEFEKVAGLRKD